MRHGDKVNNLNRTASHRRALMANLANALIIHKRIETTLAKAKALRVYVEPLITRSKEKYNTTTSESTHNRRTVFSYLQDKEALKELFSTISEKVADRPGGYTRIIKLGTRQGDNAEMALIELVDFNEVYQVEKKAATKKTRRRGGASKKKTSTEPTENTTATQPKEDVQKQEVVEEAQPLVEENAPEQVTSEEKSVEPTPQEPSVNTEETPKDK